MTFRKGQSGNPGGRPKELKDVQSLARTHSKEAIDALVRVMRNGESEAAVVSAASLLLDRGFGRPHQTMSATVTEKRERSDWSRADLLAVLDEKWGAGPDSAERSQPADEQGWPH